MPTPPPAISLDDVSGQPGAVRAAIASLGPFAPVQRYFQNDAEQRAVELGAAPGTGALRVQPWFRRDVASPEELPPALRALWDSPRLASAAREVLGSDAAQAVGLYLNLVLPARGVDAGHYDIPSFFGLDRSNCPVWLLALMAASGLFERSYRRVATAVIWYYRGPGGALEHWPAGRDRPSVRHPAREDGALVSDNDRTFHRICSVDPAAPLELWELGAEARLALEGGRWVLREGARRAEGPAAQARLSLALKFTDPRADGEVLDLERVRQRLASDLGARGEDPRLEPGFERDPACVERLRRIYLPR